MGVSKNIGTPPNHPSVHRVFHLFSPSILGGQINPYFWVDTHILPRYMVIIIKHDGWIPMKKQKSSLVWVHLLVGFSFNCKGISDISVYFCLFYIIILLTLAKNEKTSPKKWNNISPKRFGPLAKGLNSCHRSWWQEGVFVTLSCHSQLHRSGINQHAVLCCKRWGACGIVGFCKPFHFPCLVKKRHLPLQCSLCQISMA